jgi:hypothetical protein
MLPPGVGGTSEGRTPADNADSLQLTAKHKVATPVNWKHGEDVIIAGSVSDDDAKTIYPQGGKRRGRVSESCRSRTLE